MRTMNFAAYDIASLDCYGTLVDWETGIRDTLEPMLARHGVRWPVEQLLAEYGRAESALEAGPYRTYREVLEGVVAEVSRRAGFTPDAGERSALWRSVRDWKPFPDTVAALEALARRYLLVIISNVDDAIFADTAQALRVPFHRIVTAEQVGAYKPSPKNFETAMRSVGRGPERWLHVAQSLYHDVPPAKRLGMGTVWIDRQSGKPGVTPPSGAVPDAAFPDMRSFAAAALSTLDS